MIKAERQRLILEIIQKEASVEISDLCKRFSVSEMSIRRDLYTLEKKGLLRRVYGGAIRDLGRSYEPPLQLRSTKNIKAKQLIGKKAVEMIFDGDSIALDTGTTTLEISKNLVGVHNLTIVTPSIYIANSIIENVAIDSDVRLILTGGVVRSGEFSMVGHIAERTSLELHVDKAFVTVAGISLENGLTEFNLEDAQIKKALLRTAHKRIIVSDCSKFGVTAFASICDLTQIDTLITDANAPEDMIENLKNRGIEVITVNLEV
jgi:DeoR/GlpR family transcriptional regulator of sugar metabolism